MQNPGGDAMRALADSGPERWFTPAFISAEPQVVRIAQQWLANTNPEGYAASCEALGSSDLRPALGRTLVPLMVLAGEYDTVTTVDVAKAMTQALAGARMTKIAVSHISKLEDPGGFAATLPGFLACF